MTQPEERQIWPSELEVFPVDKGELPESVRIGAHTIAVRLADAREMEDAGDYGHFSPLKMEIAVREDLASSLQWSTLLHEIIEAIGHLYRLELEEYQVDVLSEGLTQALTSRLGFRLEDKGGEGNDYTPRRDTNSAG